MEMAVSKTTRFFATIGVFAVLTTAVYLAIGLLVGKADAAVQADASTGGICFTTEAEYAQFYVGSYGYAYYANIPVKVRVCGYSATQMTALNKRIVNRQLQVSATKADIGLVTARYCFTSGVGFITCGWATPWGTNRASFEPSGLGELEYGLTKEREAQLFAGAPPQGQDELQFVTDHYAMMLAAKKISAENRYGTQPGEKCRICGAVHIAR